MPILTYFAMGSITVQLSSSLAGLDKVSLHTLKLTIYLLIFFNPNQLKSRPMIRCLRLLRYPTTFQFKSYLKRFFNWGGIDLKLTDMFFNEWPVSNFEIKAKQNIKFPRMFTDASIFSVVIRYFNQNCLLYRFSLISVVKVGLNLESNPTENLFSWLWKK